MWSSFWLSKRYFRIQSAQNPSSHRFSWYYKYCWPACILFSNNLILHITGNRVCIGKICVSEKSIFPNVPWEQFLHRETFNPSDTAMFLFFPTFTTVILKSYKTSIHKTSIYIHKNIFQCQLWWYQTFSQVLYLDHYITWVVQEYSKTAALRLCSLNTFFKMKVPWKWWNNSLF